MNKKKIVSLLIALAIPVSIMGGGVNLTVKATEPTNSSVPADPESEHDAAVAEFRKASEEFYNELGEFEFDNLTEEQQALVRLTEVLPGRFDQETTERIKDVTQRLNDAVKAMQDVKTKAALIKELDKALDNYYVAIGYENNVTELSDKAYDMVATDGEKYTIEEISQIISDLNEAVKVNNEVIERREAIEAFKGAMGEYFDVLDGETSELMTYTEAFNASLDNQTTEKIKEVTAQINEAIQKIREESPENVAELERRAAIEAFKGALGEYFDVLDGETSSLMTYAEAFNAHLDSETTEKIKEVTAQINEAIQKIREESPENIAELERRAAIEAFKNAMNKYFDLLDGETTDLMKFAEAMNAHLDKETTERIKETTEKLLAAIAELEEIDNPEETTTTTTTTTTSTTTTTTTSSSSTPGSVSDAEKYAPKTKAIVFFKGQRVFPEDAYRGIENLDELPAGTKVAFKYAIITNNAGDYNSVLTVTYPDGSFEDVDVVIRVTGKNDPAVTTSKAGESTTKPSTTKPEGEKTTTKPGTDKPGEDKPEAPKPATENTSKDGKSLPSTGAETAAAPVIFGALTAAMGFILRKKNK